jgi:NAD(P)-dependent dehydrogenase (short-subunit alcohol dehydrogenase family)
VPLEGSTSCEDMFESSQATDRVERLCRSALALARETTIRAWAPRLWFVTRRATPVTGVLDVAGGALWGFGRTLANEHPEFCGGLIDVDGGDDSESASLLIDEITSDLGEPAVALASGRRMVARLARLKTPLSGPVPAPRADATYVVTGALGGIGRAVVDWLVEHGARHLALFVRREPTADEARALECLREAGRTVVLVGADVAVEEQVVRGLESVRRAMPPLAGVFHVAGIYDDALIERMDWPQMARVLAPKITGGLNLHRHTEGDKLDHFVLFASGASILGSGGLANYAAANAGLDALAHLRRTLGLPAISVDWGPWASTGMAEAVGAVRRGQWTQGGFETMPVAEALRLMAGLMSAGAPAQVAALPVDWRVFRATPTGQWPLYTSFSPVTTGGTASGQPSGASVLPFVMSGVPGPERHQRLLALLRVEIGRELGISADGVPVNKALNALGFDSLMAVQLRNRLQTLARVPVSVVDLLKGPTVEELAASLLRRLDESQPSGAAAVEAARAAQVAGAPVTSPSTAPAGSGGWDEGSV